MEIFKIQRPLSTNVPEDSPALIYNQDRSVEQQFPISPELSRYFEPFEFKVYVYGEVDDQGTLQLHDKAEQQEW